MAKPHKLAVIASGQLCLARRCMDHAVSEVSNPFLGNTALKVSVDAPKADRLVVGLTGGFVDFVSEDAIVAMIMLDLDVEGLGISFKMRFTLDDGFGIIVFMKVDVVEVAEVVDKDGGVVVSSGGRSPAKLRDKAWLVC